MVYHTDKTTSPYQALSPPPLFYDLIFNPKGTEVMWFAYFSKDHVTSIFTQPPVVASSIFFWDTATQTTWYHNLDHITFLHHC